MGKQKRQRRKLHKENPIGLPSVKDFDEAQAEECTNETREAALQKVYEELQSPNVEEKLSGLQTVETMSCDSALAVQIAKNEIAKMIGPLLVDPSIPVRAATASALRHIADNGKTEAYASLLNDDIMTPLCTLLKQYYTEWQTKSEQREKGKLNDERQVFIQAVTLLWTLCENNEHAIRHCNNEDLVTILMKFFDSRTYGIEISTISAQCLLSLSEDNPPALKKLRLYEGSLVELLNSEVNDDDLSDVICLKTTTAGLLMNLTDCMEDNPMNTICKVITVLSEALAVSCKDLLKNLTGIVPHDKNAYSNSAKKKVKQNRQMFSAQQQALEIIANLCVEDKENCNDSDLNDSDSVDGEIDEINDVCMDDKPYKMLLSLPLEIVEVFNSCEILKRVWEKTLAVDTDTVEILEQNTEGKEILKQMHTLRCRAYLCLNNLISTLEIDALGGMDNIYRMWVEIGTVVFKETDPNDIELLESATAALRATLQRLSEAKANIFNQLTLADIQPMLNGERQCPNANVRANLIRILGNLALVLINNDTPEAQELIKNISLFLLDTCALESEAWVMAESLDTLMDMYAEDDTDRLASEIRLTEKIRSVVPLFKDKARGQKKNLGDSAAIVSTVNANIMRFIKYKEKRIKNIH